MKIGDNRRSNPTYDDSDLEVMDVENYRSDKFQVFNHQVLVMEALRAARESGGHELRTGWYNEKIDKGGNVTLTYIEDTRKRFIECVKTAKNIMACDFDEEAQSKILVIEKNLKVLRIKLLKEQWDWFVMLPPKVRMQWEGKINRAFFNFELGWYLKYIEEETECYRQIFQELHALTKRLDYYQAEEFVA